MCKDWTIEEHEALRRDVPRMALTTPFRTGTVRDLALRVLEIADAGLAARAVPDWDGSDERKYLSALWKIARSGVTQAEERLERVATEWDGDVDPLFEAYAY